MSRYSVAVPACVVQQAFAGVDVALPFKGEDACLYFGYDDPLAVYFLDVEDADEYREFAYGGIFFVPGTRLTRGQMQDVLHVHVDRASSDELAKFRDAIVMDLPVQEGVMSYVVRVLPGTLGRRMIVAREGGGPVRCGWDTLQQLKNEYLGEEVCAVEIFPPHSEVVDEVN